MRRCSSQNFVPTTSPMANVLSDTGNPQETPRRPCLSLQLPKPCQGSCSAFSLLQPTLLHHFSLLSLSFSIIFFSPLSSYHLDCSYPEIYSGPFSQRAWTAAGFRAVSGAFGHAPRGLRNLPAPGSVCAAGVTQTPQRRLLKSCWSGDEAKL